MHILTSWLLATAGVTCSFFLTFLGEVIVPLFFIFLGFQQNGLVIPLYVSYEYKELGDAD